MHSFLPLILAGIIASSNVATTDNISVSVGAFEQVEDGYYFSSNDKNFSWFISDLDNDNDLQPGRQYILVYDDNGTDNIEDDTLIKVVKK